MNRSRDLRFVLIAILVLALGAVGPVAAQSPSPCAAGYQDSYAAHWELSREDWAKACAKAGTADAALRESQSAFQARCAADAQPSVLAGLVRAEDLAAFCSQGVPGRAKIPRPAAGANGARQGAAPSAGTLASQEQAVGVARANVGAATNRIGTALKTDVATLYSEHTVASEGTGVVLALPSYAASKPRATPPAVVKDATQAVPPIPYAPTDKAKAPYLIILDQRMMANGASPEAVTYLWTRYRDMLEQLDVNTLRNLINNHQNLAIIPKDKTLTEVPPFTMLKGQSTFDGRKWETVRGVAGVPMGPGKPGSAVAISEENLLKSDVGYPQGFTFFHEYGHAVKSNGLDPKTPPPAGWIDTAKRMLWGDPATQQRVHEIYTASMKRPEKTGLDDYANSNDDEFYAQSTAAFFGVGYLYHKVKGDKVLFTETPVTLYKGNSDIYKLCETIYGKPGRYWKK